MHTLAAAPATLIDQMRLTVEAAEPHAVFAHQQFASEARQSVGWAFRKLETEGVLVKLEKGVWCKPLPASPEQRQRVLGPLLFACGQIIGQTLVSDGAGAAFELGLLDRAPLRPVFLTTRHERRLEIGRVQVALIEADDWWFEAAGTPAGSVIRALGWAGSSKVQEAWSALQTLVPRDALFEASLRADRLPLWMREPIQRFR